MSVEVFKTTMEYGAVLGGCEPRPGQSRFNGRNVTVLIIFGLNVISASTHLLFDPIGTFQGYAIGMFCWLTLLSAFIGFFVGTLKIGDLFRAKKTYEEMLENQSHDPITKCLYDESNKSTELWTKVIYTFCIKIIIPLGAIPILCASYYRYYTTDLGTDAFIVVDQIKVPFNILNPVGYAVGAVIQIGSLTLSFYAMMLGLGIIIAYFYGATACAWDIQRLIQDINDNYKSDQNDAKIICGLRDIYRYSSKVKDLVADFMRPIKYIITIIYCWSLFAICDTFLMCHMAEKMEDYFIPVIFAFSAFTTIFIFCELGERITYAVDKGQNELYGCDWYMFPMEIQNVLRIIICSTQKSIGIEGFGNIVCTRESFKRVTTRGYSSFTTLTGYSRGKYV